MNDESIRLLVADDEALTRNSIIAALGKSKLRQISSHASATDVVKHLSTCLPESRPHLALMDIRMRNQRFDGIHAAHILYHVFHIPSIFVTAHDDTVTIERAMLAGGFGFIKKSASKYHIETLIASVRMALHNYDRECRLDESIIISSDEMDGIIALRIPKDHPFSNIALSASALINASAIHGALTTLLRNQSDSLSKQVAERRWTQCGRITWAGRTFNVQHLFCSYPSEFSAENRFRCYRLNDVTETVRREQEARKHELALANIGTVCQHIAHDVGNYIKNIYASSELQQLRGETVPQKLKQQIEQSREGAEALMANLHVLVSDEIPNMQSVTSRFLDECVTNANLTFGNPIIVVKRLSSQHAMTMPSSIKVNKWDFKVSVLLNIFKNSWEACKRVGVTVCEIAFQIDEILIVDESDIDKALWKNTKPGRFVRLAMTDNGGGMPVEFAANILKEPQSTKSDRALHGLGLASACRVVAYHGGFISVSTNATQGCTVSIYLPLVIS